MMYRTLPAKMGSDDGYVGEMLHCAGGEIDMEWKGIFMEQQVHWALLL
jgi:hypothetical protein